MEIEDMAADHVDWFLDTIRPLLITHFVHGYKHGLQYGEKPKEINTMFDKYRDKIETWVEEE